MLPGGRLLLLGLRPAFQSSDLEDDMENAAVAVSMLFDVMAGLGLFFMGVGVLWFVRIYKDNYQKKE